LEVVWTFEQNPFSTLHGESNSFWHTKGTENEFGPNDRNKLLFIQIQTIPLSMHHKWKENIDIVCKATNEKS
jgi:hypothetical protein